MHKRELIQALREFVDNGKAGWRGQRSFASYLAHYLENLHIPSDEKYDFWRIEPYLPQILTDAFEALRTETDEKTVEFREMYKTETGHEVPNITDLGTSDILAQSSAVQATLGFLMREVTGEAWIESEIDKYCNAQQHLLIQTFDKFVRHVYRQGLFDIINDAQARGMSGAFGKTTLRSYVLAGRLMFTFARSHSDSEVSVSFVGEEDDSLGLPFGLQSVYSDLRSALDMIEEVIQRWPAEQAEQKRIFHADKKVSIG